jgi:hypothetical protein
MLGAVRLSYGLLIWNFGFFFCAWRKGATSEGQTELMFIVLCSAGCVGEQKEGQQ